MQNRLFAAKDGIIRHLARLDTAGARHLACGSIILSPDDYRAYFVGQYDNNNPNGGFLSDVKPKTNGCNSVIASAISMLLNDSGKWVKGAYVPPFASTCGTCGIGCDNGNGVAAFGLNSGCWICVPNKHFSVPSGRVVTSARIRIKGYSDRFVDTRKFRSGTVNVSSWSYPFRDYLLNNAISGTTVTPKSVTGQQYTSKAAEMVLANCHWDRASLPAKRAFFTTSAHGVHTHGELAYDTLLSGCDGGCSTEHSMSYYLTGMVSEANNPTFAGLVGCNPYPSGGTTENYANAFPLLSANDGTVTHRSQTVSSVEWGEFKQGANGTFMKQVGAHWYRQDMISPASSDATWNVCPYIELPAHHVNWFNQHGGIWVMLSMPAPFFNTTDTVDIGGGARQIWIEDYKLEVELS